MEERQTIIDLKGIVKRFYIGQPNELEILHGIDLQVKKGEFVSIVGSSGSGTAGLEPVQKANYGSDQAAALAGQFTGRTADRPRCPDAYRQGQSAPIGPYSYGSGAGGVHRVLAGGEGRPTPPLAATKPRAFGPS